ncbi:zinc-binding dehydrogenase [Oceanispirochaeta sp.]|jgi:NADPH:quinone reductase-like Zn-dependent oxidoreductase|uniref:zinc-binding dehydrogenase n=1 Tax=Oceanispirochaeta sp. TaxID=2035350 RepID=UPI00262F360D|nr:zinc-binding dehydrogenase [Oceanispirochaeta sp.]MDA3958364.1 zinc-binding dehydrogenase [Oceanispirochaeta sp.]
MTKSMIFTAPGELEIVEETVPVPGKGQVLVKNWLSLISPGTELALFTGTHVGFNDPDIEWARYPLRPGYATAGIREDTGELIMYYGLHSTHGLFNPEKDPWATISEETMEPSLFGRFAQISGTVPELAAGRSGNVLVFGAGLIGNFCAQLFQLNHKVIIADISDKRLRLASACGIESVINSAKEDLAGQIKELTDGEGVDIITEATGVPGLVSQALELVNTMGSVYLLGSSRGEVCLNAYKYIHRKGTSLIGAHESTVKKPLREQLQSMISLLNNSELKTGGMITHRIVPEQAQEYYNHLLNDRDNYLGILIDWRY